MLVAFGAGRPNPLVATLRWVSHGMARSSSCSAVRVWLPVWSYVDQLNISVLSDIHTVEASVVATTHNEVVHFTIVTIIHNQVECRRINQG